MSRYEWERGEIKLPAKAYPKFRQDLIKAWNNYQDELFKQAVAAYEAVKAAGKGKRNFAHRDWFEYEYRPPGNWHDETRWEIQRLIFKRRESDQKTMVVKPQKKDLGKLPISKDCVIRIGETTITLCKPLVIWNVPENNHAAERIKEHPVAQAFFRLLDKIEWTRGSGGEIVGNDEYNRESEHSGGGANYTVREYRWKSAKEKATEAKARRSMAGSYYGSGYGRRW